MTEYVSTPVTSRLGKSGRRRREGYPERYVHRNMLPRASQRGVPFYRETRLWAIRSSHQRGGAGSGRRSGADLSASGRGGESRSPCPRHYGVERAPSQSLGIHFDSRILVRADGCLFLWSDHHGGPLSRGIVCSVAISSPPPSLSPCACHHCVHVIPSCMPHAVCVTCVCRARASRMCMYACAAHGERERESERESGEREERERRGEARARKHR